MAKATLLGLAVPSVNAILWALAGGAAGLVGVAVGVLVFMLAGTYAAGWRPAVVRFGSGPHLGRRMASGCWVHLGLWPYRCSVLPYSPRADRLKHRGRIFDGCTLTGIVLGALAPLLLFPSVPRAFLAGVGAALAYTLWHLLKPTTWATAGCARWLLSGRPYLPVMHRTPEEWRATVLVDDGRIDEAVALARTLPTSSTLLFWMGHRLVCNGHYQLGLPFLRQLDGADLDPSTRSAIDNQMLYALSALAEDGKAATGWTVEGSALSARLQAVPRWRTDDTLRTTVAQFLVHQGDPEGALKLLARWGDRKDSDALVTSALAYTRMGRSNEAAQALHDAWRRDPYDPRLAGAIKTVEGEPPLSSSAD